MADYKERCIVIVGNAIVSSLVFVIVQEAVNLPPHTTNYSTHYYRLGHSDVLLIMIPFQIAQLCKYSKS